MELHATVKQVKRSSGRSSVAAAAYRSATRMVDERTGLIHDYSKKQGVERSDIFAPENAPEWAHDRAELWNACEAKENRSNSCTAHELEIGFPAEFNATQRREAGEQIARELVRRYECAVEIAYHHPSKKGDDRNFHAHIMFSTRGFDASTKDGWAKNKSRDLSQERITVAGQKTTRGKQEVLQLREFTANTMNRIAKRDRLNVQVEHKSFKERGIDQEPTQHRGQRATEMERKGKQTRIGEKNREIETSNVRLAKYQAYDALLSAKIDHARASNDPHHKPAQVLTLDELRTRQEQDKVMLYAKIQKEQRPKLNQLNAQLSRITSRIEGAKGLRKAVRDILGITRYDKRLVNEISKGLEAVRLSEAIQLRTLEKHHTYERTNRVVPAPTSSPSPTQKPKKVSGWDRHAKPEFNKATNDNGQKRDGWNRFRGAGQTRGRKPS